ncbi:MAG: SH3 domain-containing protein [Clostridia bacterium]|nr:SH3 domain-containing protein [Clostridia bacterium]
MKKIRFIICMVLMISLISALFSVPAFAAASYVETTGSVNIRSGPGPGYAVISTASEGTYLTYLDSTRYDYRDIAWYKVQCSAGKGWVSSVYSRLVNSRDPDPYYWSYVEATASANIRSGPSLNYDIISYAASGDIFVYMDSTRYDSRGVAWYRIRCSKGTGWISSTYSYLVDEDYEQYVEATASVNIRRGPGLNYRIVTSVEEGDVFDYDGRTSYDDRGVAWYRIDYYGSAYWISSVYSVLY